MRGFVLAALAAACLAGQAAGQVPPKRLRVTGDLSFVKTGGNTAVSSLAIGDKLQFQASDRLALRQQFGWTFGRSQGREISNQLFSGLRGTWDLHPRVDLFLGVNYDYNLFAGIKRRFEELAGVGVDLVDNATDELTVDAGISFFQETEVGAAEATVFTAGRVAVDYKHTFREKTWFQQTAEWLPNFDNSADYRINAETSLVAAVNSVVGLKLGWLVRYRGRPPAGVKSTDTTLRMGIQLSN